MTSDFSFTLAVENRFCFFHGLCTNISLLFGSVRECVNFFFIIQQETRNVLAVTFTSY